MKAGLGVALVCFVSTLVYCAGTQEEATKPTPPEVVAAIKELGGKATVDKNKAVVRVNFYGTKVTDAGLVHLKGLTKLEFLSLSNTPVTDAGLKHLKELTKLQYLSLSNTKVTDAGLAHLKGLNNLTGLLLAGTKVTDAGLAHLKGLTKLKRLGLWDTKVTDAGKKKLKQALPNCKISP